MLKNFKKLYYIGFGIALSLVMSGLLLVASPEKVKVWAATPSGDILGHQTISSLGKFKKGGSATIPGQVAESFGTNIIQWSAGQRPADAIPMGVWNSAFKTGQLSIAQINPTQNMDAAGLANYKFLAKTSISDLATALPSVNTANIADIKPIADFVTQKINAGFSPPSIPSGDGYIPAVKVSDLATLPEWKDMPLSNNLAGYSASELPGLANAPLNTFPHAQANPASDFPGLSNMPIANMPGFNVPSGYQIGYFDAIRTKEPTTRKVISGSKEEPNAVCDNKDCSHIELRSLAGGLLDGAQIVDGDTQSVSGGYGLLKAISGTEKTGTQPYGEPIQEVYENFNAQSGDVDRSWYFNICRHEWYYDFGCSSHFIGPIPIGSIHEGGKFPLLLGIINIPVQAPKIKVADVISQTAPPASASSKASPLPAPAFQSPPSAIDIAGLPNVPALSNKIAAILPQVDAAQVASIIQSQALKLDPSTNNPYSTDVIIRRTIEQLLAGSNSPTNNNATSLTLGKSIDSIVAQVQGKS
jgi:hypothetical protein